MASFFENFRFSTVDYIVFVLALGISTLIGIYFGWIRYLWKKPTTEVDVKKTDFGSAEMDEFLLGSRKMSLIPVAIGLVGCYISGVTIVGTPTEIYNYGTQYSLIALSILIQGFVVSIVYIPVFMKLQVKSSYEYLQLRFHPMIRTIASLMFVLDEILFLPFVIYVPGIAFSQVTGLNIYLICLCIVVITVLYTLVGGIKAVVHTDLWQTVIMFIAVVVVLIVGVMNSEGLGHIFRVAKQGGRLIFANTDPSLYTRQTLMTVLIGGTFYWISFNSVNQTMVQRYVSLPTLRKAQMAMAIFSVCVSLFVLSVCFLGLLIYDVYRTCDPLSAGLIERDDQLMVLYVVQRIGFIYGVPGIFMAGLFGAALSSLSVVLHSTALVVLEDLIRGSFKKNPGPRTTLLIVKGTIVVLGVISMILVFFLDKLRSILGPAIALTAIASGTTFALFTLGMLVPWANSIGTAIGGICGAFVAIWLAFGQQWAIATGKLYMHQLEVRVDGCEGNVTLPEVVKVDETNVFPLYRLSFHWVNPIAVTVALVIGSLLALCTKPTKINTINRDLLSPVIHRLLPKEAQPPPPVKKAQPKPAENPAPPPSQTGVTPAKRPSRPSRLSNMPPLPPST